MTMGITRGWVSQGGGGGGQGGWYHKGWVSQGGGGGQDFYATAGGKNTDGLTIALETGIKILKKKL